MQTAAALWLLQQLLIADKVHLAEITGQVTTVGLIWKRMAAELESPAE